jgi:hypothetical protein
MFNPRPMARISEAGFRVRVNGNQKNHDGERGWKDLRSGISGRASTGKGKKEKIGKK